LVKKIGKIFILGAHTNPCTVGVKFGVEELTEFLPHRCSVSPMGCGKSQNRPPRNNKSAVFSLVNLAVKTTLSAFAAERRAAAPLLLSAGIFCLRSTSPDSGVLSSKPAAATVD